MFFNFVMSRFRSLTIENFLPTLWTLSNYENFGLLMQMGRLKTKHQYHNNLHCACCQGSLDAGRLYFLTVSDTQGIIDHHTQSWSPLVNPQTYMY